jgi:pimeloyl-ACP methyl ester carboxylesterase
MGNSAWVDMLGGEVCYFDAKGIRTRCLHAGSGPPLVLLHGMGGHAEAYLKNILPLAQSFHVYAIDMVGHGFTDKPEIDYAIPDFVDHVIRFLNGAGLERVHLQGESLGGWISAWLTIDHPERVLSLTLNTSAGLKLTEQPPEAEARAVERLRNLTREAVAEPTRESVRRRLEWLFLKPEEQVTEELVEIRYQIYRRPDTRQAMKRIVEEMTGGGRLKYMLTADRLRRITVPTQILWSEHNPTTPWQVAEQAHQIIPGSRFHVIKDCGHWPQWEQAEEFNSHMTDFLCAVPSR